MPRKFSSKRPLTDEEEAEVQAMIAADPDDEELTEEMAAQRMTFAEACPELTAAIRRERERKTNDGPETTKRPARRGRRGDE
ncbi:hypothetical protein [Bosea vestrisii]|uniref:Transcriptional regulator n=1 Tax=Bosea vestrisii TaxID=151416 RepID=A0ABW0H7I0_9HYPH